MPPKESQPTLPLAKNPDSLRVRPVTGPDRDWDDLSTDAAIETMEARAAKRRAKQETNSYPGLSVLAIVRAVAEQAARHITRQVIAALQQRTDTLSGDDSELKTTWDEICVQLQYEESISWDAYDKTVRDFVAGYVFELPTHEREAIWYQTDAGKDWECEEPQARKEYPVFDDDIVNYLVRHYVYAEANRWSNTRIRGFIERSRMRD